jgi:hypothetical protein
MYFLLALLDQDYGISIVGLAAQNQHRLFLKDPVRFRDYKVGTKPLLVWLSLNYLAFYRIEKGLDQTQPYVL